MKLSEFRSKKPFVSKSLEWYLNDNLNHWIEQYQYWFKQREKSLRWNIEQKGKWRKSIKFDEEMIYSSVRNAARNALELMVRLEEKNNG